MQVSSTELISRIIPEEECFWSPYKSDVERIVHSKAFRRYSDKTQVVYLVENDHLTHRSLHVQLVSSFARGLAEKLGLNLHLVEAISLGHDVGHPPFGHEGEGYLSELTYEIGLGAFSHARHSCRLFSEIEPLNLTFATLDGFLCHDGGMRENSCKPKVDKSWDDHFQELELRKEKPEINLRPASVEATLVKFCDTISYLIRDIEDAVHLKIISREEIPKTILGSSHRDMLVCAGQDLVTQSLNKDEISLSEEVFSSLKELRRFNFERIYVHPALKVESEKIRSAYRLLFEKLLFDCNQKATHSYLWKNFLHSKSEHYVNTTSTLQQVVDFIAGMTDTYFVRAMEKLIVPQKIAL